MKNLLWSCKFLVVLGLFVVCAAVPAAAQVEPHDPGKSFKCPPGQHKFCLKNNGNGPAIVTGVTVYSQAGQAGNSHQLLDSQNGGDDVTIQKGKYACWCASFKPKSYKVTVGADANSIAMIDDPNFLEGDVPLLAAEEGTAVVMTFDFRNGETLPTLEDGTAVYADRGAVAELPGAQVTTADGDPYDGWLTVIGTFVAVNAVTEAPCTADASPTRVLN